MEGGCLQSAPHGWILPHQVARRLVRWRLDNDQPKGVIKTPCRQNNGARIALRKHPLEVFLGKHALLGRSVPIEAISKPRFEQVT
jgi:hypothetical protein